MKATVTIEHISRRGRLLSRETTHNLVTTAGVAAAHRQVYGTSALLTNGANFIGVSEGTFVETVASTVLGGELAVDGFARIQGTVTLAPGVAGLPTVTRVETVFTAQAARTLRKAALFTASADGTMVHVVGFVTDKALDVDEQIRVRFDCTLEASEA